MLIVFSPNHISPRRPSMIDLCDTTPYKKAYIWSQVTSKSRRTAPRRAPYLSVSSQILGRVWALQIGPSLKDLLCCQGDSSALSRYFVHPFLLFTDFRSFGLSKNRESPKSKMSARNTVSGKWARIMMESTANLWREAQSAKARTLP